MSSIGPLRAIAITASIVAVGLSGPAAWACGGLFCDSSSPVSQSAERIIFVDHDDGRVSAVVEILYRGDADRFSWLVPVPGIPEIGLSSTAALDLLQLNTDPQYIVSTDFSCFLGNDRNNGINNGANNGTNNGGGGVNVIAAGNTGPFDWEVIEVDPNLEDPAQAATDWLEREGYDVQGPELIRPYLEAGMNILGFRLDKYATTGSIRPVILTYDTDHPMIPIKLTAVAAQDDMGVLTWVGGPSRAVPTNYRHLVINDALLNWFNPSSNYGSVINAAADEAGGQGWVTEYADRSRILEGVIWSRFIDEVWTDIKADGNDEQLLQALLFRFFGLDGRADVVRMSVTLPVGTTPEQFLQQGDTRFVSIADRALFVALMDELVVDPMRDTQELVVAAPWITRFFTTLSAQEMTTDPEFEFNPDLGIQSNIHVAQQVFTCDEDDSWSMTLPSGAVVYGSGFNWPVEEGELPANRTIEQLATTGQPLVVRDNSETIDSALAARAPKIPGDSGGEGCACDVAESSPGSGFVGLLLLFVGVIARARIRP